ncbi:MAG: cysteine--tRNA ligase [bacterium]
MALKIYNTASRQKEDFAPQNPPVVTMYNCGPTVYDFFHIGNARNFVVVDTVRRYLRHRGFQVRFAQNFTDIDDKIIRRALETGEPWDALAQRFIGEYFKAADALGIERADIHPRATDHIPQMITLAERLIARGSAYERGGDVYYRVRSFNGYGELSGRDINDLLEGARVEVGEQKDDPLDFALWKASKPGEPSWPSPWGPGRPGWHIECSAMCMSHLGETIDIHSGGSDLVFPHHENERAQSMGATGKPFVCYWLHNGFLTINTEKMSKSLGNFSTINEALEKFPAAAVRFYLLSAHYRHPLDYSLEALEEAQSAVGRLRDAVVTAEKLFGSRQADATPAAADEIAGIDTAFTKAMDDDFNTQKAIGVIFEAVSILNEKRQQLACATDGDGGAGAMAAAGLIGLIRRMLGILGLDALIFTQADASESAKLADQLIGLLIHARTLARENKQFKISDFIRDELDALGIRLQDHPSGTIWLRNESKE